MKKVAKLEGTKIGKIDLRNSIIIKGWPKVLVFLFLAIFILQLVLLIILNLKD